MSTYKRPEILKKQLAGLSRQSFPDFEVVVSDNDPDASAREVVLGAGDRRFKYFHNGQNLGMIPSFNKSIERASTTFIVMITDDDPVEESFLDQVFNLVRAYPGYSVYAGFDLLNTPKDSVTAYPPADFPLQILDPKRTRSMLWSSSVVNRDHAIRAGLIPDYGSPHLADHAFLAQTGSIGGGVILNRMFGVYTSHDNNFSKFNFEAYLKGCTGFYHQLTNGMGGRRGDTELQETVEKHLKEWFFANIFNLKKYYYKTNKAGEVDAFAAEILKLPYMNRLRKRYRFKSFVLRLKRIVLGLK